MRAAHWQWQAVAVVSTRRYSMVHEPLPQLNVLSSHIFRYMNIIHNNLSLLADQAAYLHRMGDSHIQNAIHSSEKSPTFSVSGIRYPLIQGGIRYVLRAELVAAVANAGGLGFLSAHSSSSPEDLYKKIEKIPTLIDKPFGVNLTILSKLSVKPEDSACVILDAGVK